MAEEKVIALKAEGISKHYEIFDSPRDILFEKLFGKQRHSKHWALQDISFEVYEGEVVGVIGRNGAGKSTLLKILAGTLAPTSGDIHVNGKISAILELGTGFHPEYTGRENIITGSMVMGLSRSEALAKSQSIIEFSELEDVIDQKFKTYSSGMAARLIFSTAMSIDPDIFIVDEALAAGDAFFVPKALNRIVEICESGSTVFFVSHSADLVGRLCDRAIYLEEGKIKSIGDAVEICSEYERASLEATSKYNLHSKKGPQFKQSQNDHLAAVPESEERTQQASIQEDNSTEIESRELVSVDDIGQLDENNQVSDLSNTLEIIGVRLFSSAGGRLNETYAIRQYDDLAISIELNVQKPVSNPAVWVKFMRSDGVLATSWLSHEPDYNNLGEIGFGRHEIILSAKKILLGDGQYFVTVALFPDKGSGSPQSAFYDDPYFLWDRCCTLSVARKGRPLSTVFDQPFSINLSEGADL
jgi:ABC-type polysaccharide/polyol phosphate transport system ATPase subunit